MMAADERDVPDLVDNPAENGRPTEQKKRLESLLLDDSDSAESVDHLVDREVKVVGGGTINLFGSLFILVLLCALLLGSGYYFLGRLPPQQPADSLQSYYVSPKLPIPVRPKIDIPAAVAVITEEVSSSEPVKTAAVVLVVNSKTPLFTVTVGPFINDVDLQQAVSRLRELGFQPQKKPGRGQVTMIRLLAGRYSAVEARQHLEDLKKVVKSAFLLAEGDSLAVYAGSFHQEDRALQMQADLAQEMINVSLVDSEVTMNGTMLVALQADQQTAREVAAHIASLGLHTQLLKKE